MMIVVTEYREKLKKVFVQVEVVTVVIFNFVEGRK